MNTEKEKMMRNLLLNLVIAAITIIMLVGCSAATSTLAPGGASTAAATTTVAALPSSTTASTAAAATATLGATPSDMTASAEADPCQLVTQTEAEALAGSTVTVESGALPGPAGEGSFCRYKTQNLEELEIRTAVGRGDYENDRKFSSVNEWHVADVPGFGDEAWSDKSPLIASINLIARGAWIRISASSSFTKDPSSAVATLAAAAIERLP